jgi:hypothetical protein
MKGAGMFEFIEPSLGASSFMIATIVSAPVRLWKAGTPAIISNSTDPNENWSERKSIASPRACSGDMYKVDPMIVPGFVVVAVVVLDA